MLQKIPEYSSDSKNCRGLNILVLHKVLDKTLYYRCLAGPQLYPQFLNGKVTESAV